MDMAPILTKVTEKTPYPLRPGTSPVNSGECFTCGHQGHLGSQTGKTCEALGHRILHPNKQQWRVICSHILKEPKVATNVHLVAIDDYGTTLHKFTGSTGKWGRAVNVSTSLTALITRGEEKTSFITKVTASDVSEIDPEIPIFNLYDTESNPKRTTRPFIHQLSIDTGIGRPITELWLALLLTICRPLSTGHCAQYRWFYYNAIVIVCQSYCK